MSHLFGEPVLQHMDLLDAVVAVIVVYDCEDRIVFFNHHAETTTGFQRDSLLGQRIADCLFAAGDPHPACHELAANDQTLANQRYSNRWRTRDGELRIINWTSQSVLDEHGHISHVIATGIDVTELRLGEQQILRHAEQQEVINNLLHISMEESSLQHKLTAAAQSIMASEWIDEQAQLALFMINDGKQAELCGHHRLHDATLAKCRHTGYRQALCDPALHSGHIQFIDSEQQVTEVGEHCPYYSVPIKSEERVVAVMVLFVEYGHPQDLGEIVMLHTLASTLASIVNRHTTEQHLKHSRRRLLEAQRIARIGSWEWRSHWQHIECSAVCRQLLGLADGITLSYRAYLRRVHKDDRRRVHEHIRRSLQHGGRLLVRHMLDSGADKPLYVVLQAECRLDAGADDAGNTQSVMLGTLHDISDQVQNQQQQQLIASVFDGARESIMVLDASRRIVRVNDACCAISGYRREELVGQYIDLLHSDRHDELFYNEMWSELETRGGWYGEVWSRRKNGELFPEWRTISAVKTPQAGLQSYLLISMDLSELRRSEERIHQLVYYDSLTQLPNRSLFKSTLLQHIDDAHRQQRQLAVMSIGLDGLARINDSLGHSSGDTMLKIMASRLQQCVRSVDMVARWGSDQFTLLLTDLHSRDNAVSVASKILNRLLEPFDLDDTHQIVVGVAIGISLYPADGSEAMTLIQNADVAMHQARSAGGNRYALYHEEMNLAVLERLSIETGLRNALEKNQFELHYQALLRLDNKTITGAEALIRWRHPRRGMVPPDRFIGVAEESGLIIPIGKRVLNEACRQCVAWQQQGLGDLHISVNLSARQFHDEQLIENVRTALDQAGLAASRLTLEITESSVMENASQTIETLHRLKQLGVNLSIDDFGTGYSSLAYLKRFPIDKLKIDRSFVHEVDSNPNDHAIVQSIIAMSHSLKLGVIAEGVEKPEHLHFLHSRHCGEAQGFLISKPLAATQFVEFVKQWRKDNTRLALQPATRVHRL